MSDGVDQKREQADPLLGKVLAGRYSIVRKLGSGGMGSVYEGRHTLINKRVAIKVLHPEIASLPSQVRRFIDEARAAATLGHKHIVDALDAGNPDTGEAFIVLEYLEGRDLASLIKELGVIPLPRAVRIVKQVASALAAAHAHRIVHRDIKPNNVFLVRQDDGVDMVKVIDFGVSKIVQADGAQATRAGETLGTPAYMAPEQLLDSSAADGRADVYSVGVMLYQMLVGKRPFEAETFANLVFLVFSGSAVPVTTLRPELPAGIAEVVAKAMARELPDRFQTMEELSSALDAFTGSSSSSVADGTRVAESSSSRGADPVVGNSDTGGAIPRTRNHPAPLRALSRCPVCNEAVGDEAHCPRCGKELPDARLGMVLAGRYRVDRLLGAGGVGRVYVGTHLAFNEPVAIKFLLAEWTGRGDFRARFKLEAMTVARLRHPGIVVVHDYGEHEGELFMVMEMVKGRTLRDLTEAGPIPPARAFALTEKLLEVMEFAHAQGIVHRDLKPENVMLLDLGDDTDRIKVLDFGLALAVETPAAERLTAAGAAQGTPAYMSPEQCRGRDVGAPTDIYAVGTILYEMLCGETPFTADTFTELMVRQLFIAAPKLSDRGTRRAHPEAFEALVQSALAKAPEARPTSAAFREQLQLVLRGDDPTSRAAREANERLAHGALSREQRAPAQVTGAVPSATAETRTGRAILWGLQPDRIDALVPQFTVNGINASSCPATDPPAAMVDGQPTKAVLVPWSDPGRQCLAWIRANPAMARVPVLVVDAALDQMPAIIRAGATDVAYVNATPDSICRQVSKLMRRAK